jgi:hypothetical protein
LLADDGLRQRAPGSQRAARGRGERREAEARNSADLRGWARHVDDVETAPTEHSGACLYTEVTGGLDAEAAAGLRFHAGPGGGS